VAGLLVVCALLLVGIVAVQVAALQQNIAQGKVDSERGQLQAANQNLQAQIDRRSSPNAIAERASSLGMVLAPSDAVQILPGG
jgi:cell division protein FtsL